MGSLFDTATGSGFAFFADLPFAVASVPVATAGFLTTFGGLPLFFGSAFTAFIAFFPLGDDESPLASADALSSSSSSSSLSRFADVFFCSSLCGVFFLPRGFLTLLGVAL